MRDRYAKPYTRGQKNFILYSKNEGYDISEYVDSRYNIEQMYEIYDGLCNNLDVLIYADPMLNYYSMREIKLCLINKLEIEPYVYKGFNQHQFKEIRIGLEEGVSVDRYARKEFKSSKMKALRVLLENKININDFLEKDLHSNCYFYISELSKLGVDISEYKDCIEDTVKLNKIYEQAKDNVRFDLTEDEIKYIEDETNT